MTKNAKRNVLKQALWDRRELTRSQYPSQRLSEVLGLKIKVPLKERCPLCRTFLTFRERSKYDKSIDIDEVSQAEYLHNEFWRTMDSLVEDYKDEDEEVEKSYDSDDIELTS